MSMVLVDPERIHLNMDFVKGFHSGSLRQSLRLGVGFLLHQATHLLIFACFFPYTKERLIFFYYKKIMSSSSMHAWNQVHLLLAGVLIRWFIGDFRPLQQTRVVQKASGLLFDGPEVCGGSFRVARQISGCSNLRSVTSPIIWLTLKDGRTRHTMTSFAGYDFLTRGVEVPWLPSHYHEITHEKANQIAHIDAEVMRANDYILKVLNRRASLNRMRNSFVPAVNLPAELLATIFEWACCSNDVEPNVFDKECLPQDVKPEDEAKLLQESYTDTCAEIRLAIGRVCSVWRSVALDTPQLWSNITLPVDEEDADDQAEKLQYILSKSGQRPLSVRLVELIAEYDPHKDIDEPLGGIPSTVIDTLEMQAHRLRALNIILPVTWEPALNRMANRMSLLVRITLHRPHDSDTVYPVECFASAPRLREVILMRYNISSVVLPWGQLERLEGKCSGLSECLDILRRCPRLRHCSIKLIDHDYLNVKVLAPLTHTKLESLKLFMNCSKDDFVALFDTLTLPMLRSLEIDYPQMTPLFTFFVRSACRLETLCLKGIIEEDNLIACLQALPELRKLIRGVASNGRYRVPTQRILDFIKTHNISFRQMQYA